MFSRAGFCRIAGDHHYYDVIDGFGRQFAEPTSNEGEKNREGLTPQLSIPGFKRAQSASYVALNSPFEWCLWGLDNGAEFDIRQQEFLKSLGPQRPDRLILATPEPSTVLGVRAKPDGKVAQGMHRISISRCLFWDPASWRPLAGSIFPVTLTITRGIGALRPSPIRDPLRNELCFSCLGPRRCFPASV